MQYTVEIDINLPREQVIALFDNPQNLKHWQPGFISLEPMSGSPGQVGAKSKLKYQMGSRAVELIETVTVRNLPDEFSGTYETQGMWNEIKNHFKDLGTNRTQWTAHIEFRASSLAMKAMMALMPAAFKKRSSQLMQNFKAWAERYADAS